MKQAHLVTCDLGEGGLYLSFSDGRTFFLSEAFLFAARFTHGELVPSRGVEPGFRLGNEGQSSQSTS